jgi:hypothetical protein
MVYCGKPSKGCAPCRAKRTKVGRELYASVAQNLISLQCDLKLPTCSQCKRTGRICTGYRHLGSIEFQSQKSVEPASHPRSPDLMEEQQWTIPSLYMDINPHFPEENAARFFFGDFVLQQSSSPRSIYDLLPRLYGQTPPNSALSNVVAALGIACLATAMNFPELMMKANMRYAISLKRTNSALRDPAEAKADETLLVVMLLGLYEEVRRIGILSSS